MEHSNLNWINAYLGKLSLKLLMSTWVLPRALLTWSFILCRRSHSAATQLRVTSSCEPSFLRSASVTWVDFLGANPRTLITDYLPWGCIYLSLIPHTWFSPGRGPLMGRIYTRVSQRWRGYFTSQVFPPMGTRTYGLEATFLCYYSELSSPEASLGRPFLGDAFLGRCLSLAMTRVVNMLTFFPWVPRGVPPCVDSDLWSTPGDGTVHTFTILQGYLRRSLPHVIGRLFWVLKCCQICVIHTPLPKSL